ncbi:MAG: chitobiase/beta-hexosaminidase C-terminal domain-containing protein [Prevotella sp.]|nr:chitobiase/beta-hexosaminidase C-terminal domain-containing protein [Prevotella sp.]
MGTKAWADDYSGTYYIANHNSGSYSDGSNDNFYMVPAKDPQQTNYNDAYYSANYSLTKGDPETPFITTYKTVRDNNSIWQIVSAGGGYYYIKHWLTGKYLIYMPAYTGTKIQRKAVHLVATDTPDNFDSKFDIQVSSTGVSIRPISLSSGNRYLNPASGNKTTYYGQNPPDYYGGLVGVYNSATDGGSIWYLEDAVLPPSFSVSASGDISITAEDGTTIYYTTNGTTPTTSSTEYSGAITPTAGMTAIKAIAARTSDTSKKSNAVSLPLHTYTYYIINRAGDIAIKKEVTQSEGKTLSTIEDIPADIRSSYLADESASFYSFSEPYTSIDQLTDEVEITETPSANAPIYVTYTTDHLSEKFLHLRGARAFNIKNLSNECAYDGNNGTLAYENANNTQPSHLWNIGGSEDPYDVQIKNVDTEHRYLVFSTPPTLALAATATTKFIIMAGSANGDGSTYEQIKLMAVTGTGANDFSKAEVKVYNVNLSFTYKLIDRKGKLIESISNNESELKLPNEWISPLVSEYHFYRTASIDGDTYTLSNPVTSTFDVGSGNSIYVNYDVSDRIDLDGLNSLNVEDKDNKTYMLRFLDGENFYQENGSDGIMTEKRKAVYPYNNGDVTLYVYGNERWDAQLAQGASTRSRWLWYIEPANNPANKAELDPYHVNIVSYQDHIFKDKDGNELGRYRSFLRTYKPEGYANVVTSVINSNPLTNGGNYGDAPYTDLATEYMILGTSSHTRLVTFSAVEGERRTVNSFEQYWKNRPTVQGILSSGNKVTTEGRNVTLTSAQKTEIAEEGWHVYTAWAYSAPWINNKSGTTETNKQYLNEEHAFQTISMGTGNFVFEEVSLEPQVILLDNHGWEVVRIPLSKTDILSTYNSPMVEQYQWYSTSDKVPGYHKYNVSGDPARTTTSLSDVSGVPEKAPDYYVTYTVKSRYATAYKGAAKAADTKASAYLLKQGGKYAKTSGSTIDKTDAPAEDVPEDMQWYLKPNFDIDREMGYIYQGETGANESAKTKDATEQDYYDAGKNGFDPYNVQIQNREYDKRYFTTNSSAMSLNSGIWTGNSTQVIMQNLNVKQHATGYDQTTLNITNATFMVVSDANGNMRFMPRFDNTKVTNKDGSDNPFRELETQAAAATTDDEGNGAQTLWLELVPEAKEIHSSSEMTEMNGHYILADDFTFDSDFTSLGTPSAPFTGTIDGQLNIISSPGKAIVAYANGAQIYNLILDNVSITSGGDHVGAICNVADGSTRIYNCGVNGGEIGGTTNVGGIVGKLAGTSRVINCYSYANITSGTNRAGIVGNNTVASTQSSLTTMIMNCMFYGDISNGGTISPIYGGTEINNVAGGMNNYNYYRYRSRYSVEKQIKIYNRALAMEEKFINRFERYRLLLNSNKKLAAKYLGIEPNELAKWVLETADRSIAEPKPYPVLKKQGQYPSIINYDAENAPDSTSVGRLNGGKLGKTLDVTIYTKSQKTTGGQSWPTASGSDVFTTSLTLIRTDKDTVRYNFNYDKVQLPYYNDIGTGNYTENRVVTGWKIVSITPDTPGAYSAADEWGGYNFADRKCTNKDKYSVSGRVFSQGAYWDVPEGVTAITIEPYWAIANYVSDDKYDVIYQQTGSGGSRNYVSQGFGLFGTQYSNNTDIEIYGDGNKQKVYTSIGNALAGFDNTSKTVYDQAVVLVGNVHQAGAPTNAVIPYTLMSIDMNHDNEPDYSYIFGHKDRQPISPIRYDFLNIMGIAEAQIPNGATILRNVSIFNPLGWFEITNTCVVNFSQFEYDNSNKNGKSSAPLILLGGTFEQFVSTKEATLDFTNKKTQYIHVGGNAWFAKFGNGTHSDGTKFTPHIPISVTGGDYDEFYLSGTFQPNITNMQSDNAECYISGGRFGEMAGASLEAIWGDVRWDIDWADITNFYGGGVNAVNPITGNIRVDMTRSHVERYCGGPKFGDMSVNKTVTTNATDCTFGTYFGAGYGGNSYNRVKYRDEAEKEPATYQELYATDRGNYYDGGTTDAQSGKNYGKKGKGVATDFDYEYFIWSTGQTGARFYVQFVTFSLATTLGVSSNLTDCTVTGNFYGGGSLGKVDGPATSILTGCTVKGNVFGAGYSATLPKIGVRNIPAFKSGKEPQKNMNIGMFEPGEINDTVQYEWQQVPSMPANGAAGMESTSAGKYVYTDEDLSTLGTVTGDVTLTLNNTTVGSDADTTLDQGNVFGGGEESSVEGNTTVTISGGNIYGSVFGGGDIGSVGNFTLADATYHAAHPDVAVGKPITCAANTGKCTVTVTGAANIGHDNMQMPDDWGHVFGAGRGTTSHEKAEKVGGNIDHVAYVDTTEVTIGVLNAAIDASPLIKASVYGGSENGHVLHGTKVVINSGQIGVGKNIGRRYTAEEWSSGNQLAPCASWDYVENGDVYDPYAPEGGWGDPKLQPGNTTATDGHTYYGNVFGGGSGVIPVGAGEWQRASGLVEGSTKVIINGGHILTSVYGGNEQTDVLGETSVEMNGGTVGVPRDSTTIMTNPAICYVFGAGKGDKRTAFNTWTNVAKSNVTIKGGTIYGSVYGGGEDGHVLGDAVTSIEQANEKTVIIGCNGKSGYDGNVFGGGQGSVTALTAGVVGGNVDLKIKKGLMYGSVYGGGRLASVGTHFEAPDDPNYGELNNDGGVGKHGNISVNLTGGTIHRNVFGGGMGTQAEVENKDRLGISRNVWLNLNKGVETTGVKGCVVKGSIFGCNNMNASPKGKVTVHVYATQNDAATQITNDGEVTTAKVDGRYDVQAVYGGGNMAAYVPDTLETASTIVIIDGCDRTSIKQVYGGGNAASTPGTSVTVNGTYEIEEVFGGGNGKDAITINGVTKDNPGANVGFYDYSAVEDQYPTKEDRETDEFVNTYVYGTGAASVNIYGGKIHRVFGGSNTKGNVKSTAITLLDESSGCDFCVDEAYGGGKSAPMDAEARLLMACIPGLQAVYGGAEAADVHGDVTLNITNGTFKRVFGGNNKSGTISGAIKVNIEEVGCRPIIIGELYGGGNLAPYSVKGYNDDGSIKEEGADIYADPQVNLKAFTSIGSVYGGGYGASAIMVGSPTVNINEVVGTPTNYPTTGKFDETGYKGDTITVDDHEVILPAHVKTKIGAIGKVFGGGNAAQVKGSATVNIGNLSTIDFESTGAGEETPRTGVDVIGADIRGNVYGGGDAAEVTGDTKVNIGRKSE